MNFITAITYIIILSYLLGLVLPWWIFTVPCFIAGVFSSNKIPMVFLSGFIAIVLLWGVYSSLIWLTNASILPSQVAEILQLQNTVLLILVTALLGGLVGGIASISGKYLRLAIG